MTAPYICRACRQNVLQSSARRICTVQNVPLQRRRYTIPSFAPKPILDLRHIRQAPGLYEQNCIDRNYKAQARNSWRILEIHEELARKQADVLELRRKNNALGKEIQRHAVGVGGDGEEKAAVGTLVTEARKLKEDLQQFEHWEGSAREEMERLALELPNLSSSRTPAGEEPLIIGAIGEPGKHGTGRSHVDIGKELNILDFEASATTSGWGWYFLKNEGALLEQALIQYALAAAVRRGWTVMTPPSIVYGHIASACGFMPRDQNGETQRYAVVGDAAVDRDGAADEKKPSLVLAGTAEIPFAASQASRTLHVSELPLKVIGPSRCYRAEAGARGVDTKGLYRVHEFTKVEMFAWTKPPRTSSTDEGGRFDCDDDQDADQTEQVFAEMLDIQREILEGLELHAKVLEMPMTDLGASAFRKVDIEAFFPSRTAINDGYGEVTSASICTDYQSRRLGTRLKDNVLAKGAGRASGRLTWPYTINGTAMAIPRVLACILENGWDEASRTVRVPPALRPYLLGGMERIGGAALKSSSSFSTPRPTRAALTQASK